MDTPEQTPETAPKSRRIRTWARVVAGLLLLLALIITPPLLNVNRLQHRIAANMSQTLGRPVHLDPDVRLHLLPMPGLTLTNLVVSEDPAFGSEPTIRATTVEATLRPSSLWRRQVEVASIRFVEPSLNLVRNQRGQLPSPRQWRHGSQIDSAPTDLRLSDPGLIRLDGSLDRSPAKADVPLSMHASWHDVPLGEATKILTGDDAGWRGMLTVDADLTGTLGDAKLASKLTVNDLRRADFVPAHLLDITTECTGSLNAMTAVLSHPQCQVPLGNNASVSALAEDFDLTTLNVHGLQIGSPGVPESWLLDWTRIFVQHIPATLNPTGKAEGSLVYVAAGDGHEGFWQGELSGDYAPLPGLPAGDEQTAQKFSIIADEDGFTIAPLNLTSSEKTGALVLSGTVDPRHYALRLNGQVTPEEVKSLQGLLPPLGENLKEAVSGDEDNSAKPSKVDVTCTRVWNKEETCATTAAPEAKAARGRSR